MYARLRALATVVLLAASLSGHAATGMVLAHLSTEHAAHHAPAASHHAHHGHARGEHPHLDHEAEHSHELVLVSIVPARIEGQSLFPQLMPVARQDLPGLVDHTATLHRARPAQRAEPLLPRRHSILLI